MVGQRFKRWSVLSVGTPLIKADGNRQRRVLCKCDCGVQKEVVIYDLFRGYSSSCGCLKREKAKEGIKVATAAWKLPGQQASLNERFRKYKRGSSIRGFTFDLDIAAFAGITQQPCHYCGAAPEPKRTYNGPYLSGGLDRVDNTLGYSLGNVVPCCRWCNIAKGTRSYNEFVAWIERTHKCLQERKTEAVSSGF